MNHAKWLILSILILTLLPAPADARGRKRSKKTKDKGPIVAGKIGAALDAHMQKQDGGFHGTALVYRKGKVLLNKGYGVADAETGAPIRHDALWDWASVTKQFTAAAILKLAMKKKLKLSDSVLKFFPKAPADKKPVTLYHLLTHTSGIQPGFGEGGPRVDFRKRDASIMAWLSLPCVRKPGEKWEYSNMAYGTLAAVIELVSGEPYEQFCTRVLFRKAGMKSACFIGMGELDLARVPKDGKGTGVPFAYGTQLTWGYRGAGGAVATTEEMLLWDRALRRNKILNKKAKKLYYQVSLNDYALGWFVHQRDGDTHITHSGSVGKTITNYLRVVGEDAVIALAYSYRPESHPERTTYELLNIARGRG